jgi:Fur family transcriptional regulator, zinc uptake regulator
VSGFPQHDHDACKADTLATAETLARDRGEKLTPLRRRVLEIVLESHRPMGAYDVLSALARDGTKPAPPTVYRALDFLRAQGFVHRIDSQSAFAACFAPATSHRSHFLLCRACGRAAEIEDGALDTALTAASGRAGFTAEQETVEITGLCADCRNTTSAKSQTA